MAEEDLMTEEAVDEGIGRRGIDMDYVKKRVDLHFETERNANRRRGQSVFNELIAKGTPYAEALREAGNAGLFYDNVAGQQQAAQYVADEEAKRIKPIPRRVINVRGQAMEIPQEGELKPLTPAPPQRLPVIPKPRSMTIPERGRMEDELKAVEENKDLRERGVGWTRQERIPDQRGVERAKIYNKYDALLAPPTAPASIPQMPSATNAPAGAVKRVRVKSPSGKGGWIPESQLQEALSTGYTRE